MMSLWAQHTILNYEVSGKRKTRRKHKRRSKNSRVRRFIK